MEKSIQKKLEYNMVESVKPANVEEIMNEEDIDGALVGGASLSPADFIDLVNF